MVSAAGNYVLLITNNPSGELIGSDAHLQTVWSPGMYLSENLERNYGVDQFFFTG